MTTGELLADGIKLGKSTVEMTLADFSDADMLHRPVKSANHAMWQLGHLTSANWMMLSVDPSVKAPPADARFGKETASVDDPAKFPSRHEVMKAFADVMDAAAAATAKMTEADLGKPGLERMIKMAPRVGDLMMLIPSHVAMHLGQFQVIRRSLGKPLLF